MQILSDGGLLPHVFTDFSTPLLAFGVLSVLNFSHFNRYTGQLIVVVY